MTDSTTTKKTKAARPDQAERRRFLDLCGTLAVGLPPAVEVLLLSAEANADHNPPGCQNGTGSANHCTGSLGQQ